MSSINCLGFNLIGDPIADGRLLSSEVAKELDIHDAEDDVGGIHTKIGPQSLIKSHGSTDTIGQKGYKLVVFRFKFDGSAAGHAAGHSAGFKNGMPQEFRAKDGEYQAITVGNASGIIHQSIVVYAYNGSVGTGSNSLDVKIDGLQPIPSSPLYHLIGQNGLHPSNHWVAPGALPSIIGLSKDYFVETGNKLYFNDASLRWGGLFDIAGDWQPSHHEHRDGWKIDIAATPTTLANEEAFLRILPRYSLDWILEGSGSSRHYHVRF